MTDNAMDNPMESTLILNISDMIDLAIGTPEVGVVDFNMLQNVLHVLAQQMRVLGKNVELRGSAAQLTLTRDNAQTVAITEYIVETDEQPQDKQKLIKVQKGITPEYPDTLLVVERVKKVDVQVDAKTPAEAGVTTSVTPSGAPTPGGVPEKVSLVTISKFNLLESTVQDLKKRVYGSIPKNETILEEVRSQTNMKSITDMWTSLNVSSRLEAAEAGLAKLSSLIQDLIGESAGIPIPAAGTPSTRPPPTTEELTGVSQLIQNLRNDLNELTANFYAALEEQGLEIPPVSVLYATTGPTSGIAIDSTQAQSEVSTRPSTPATAVASSGAVLESKTKSTITNLAPQKQRRSFGSGGVNTRLSDLEKKIAECCDLRNKSEDIVRDQLTSFQDQLEYLSKQVAAVTNDVVTGKMSDDFLKNLEGVVQIVSTVQEMQDQLKELHDTASKLATEKEERRQHVNALLEQIELLKTIKLDREDMIEAMAEKADIRLLARKVSHDTFETACDDLSKGVDRALGKLNVQESLWQQALDDIQREIELKLDKMELSPVKDFFNNKLRQLQDNLKQMADLRREVEAAGTKKRLLRDVNCISCDAKTVMAMEANAAVPVSKPLPPSLSMKPYLSYELDAIRKQQASNVPQRNMHDWENIEKQMQQPKQLAKARTDSDKHICNRYCGGSHTVTTPSQRVVRLGHFLKQWGPDVLPLLSGMATGDDGKMYKVSTVDGTATGPGAVDTVPPTPKSPKKEPTRPPSSIKPECRCLETAENSRL